MAQVLEFKLPDLGEGLTEAEIVRWLVEVGDVVAVDQPVVEVETAKAVVEVPCPYGGVVTARFGEEGTELPVGAPLLTVAVGPDSSADEPEGSGNVLVGYGTGAPPARRRRVRPRPVGTATHDAVAHGAAVHGAAAHGSAGAPAGLPAANGSSAHAQTQDPAQVQGLAQGPAQVEDPDLTRAQCPAPAPAPVA
ncbi:biotin/lipoyl-containing protein, partial [Streptomyces sp. NPDC004752]